METPCSDVDKTVPYFTELDVKNGTMNKDIFDKFMVINESPVSISEKHISVPGLTEVPDGTLKIDEANSHKFKYTFAINDYKYYQYHRNNGMTKIGIINMSDEDREEKARRNLVDTGKTGYITRPAEGALALSDRMNQAYIRSIFPDTYIVSGQQFMPFKAELEKQL